jgi:GNAT superfamily N-acetyltransferase
MTGQDVTAPKYTISRIESREALEKYLPELSALLQSCTNDDPAISSLGFLAPLSARDADEYWLSLSDTIGGPDATTVLLIATNEERFLATGQVTRMTKQTHSFRGEVRKLLVQSNTRGLGLGKAMMVEIERVAKQEMGLDLLALDTDARTPARGFYQRLGWNEWGVFPNYAKSANGVRHDCAFFCKELAN